VSQPAIDVFRAERVRQIVTLAHTAEKDNGRGAELTVAGICYLNFVLDAEHAEPATQPPAMWPWRASAWKPRNRRRACIKAGALFLAALDALPVTDKHHREMANAGLVQANDMYEAGLE
jgi:hypothetical protein